MKFNNFFLVFIFFSITQIIFSQTLSEGYQEFKLGLSKQEVENLLKTSGDFWGNKKDVIVMRHQPDQQIITVEGKGYIEIGYFHFYEDQLYQIFLVINSEKIGYYSLLKRLTDKFASPKTLDPLSAQWENETVKIEIEKPCTIKYYYLPIWNQLLNSDLSDRKIDQKSRENFVDGL
ncbi:MAG: hypothetical protein MJB14_04540 [Spirochaetes bacterium]|nr:hypothetical protein [Spirochaetota bacterium]